MLKLPYVDLEKSDFIRVKIADNVEIKISSSAVARDLTQEKKTDANPANKKNKKTQRKFFLEQRRALCTSDREMYSKQIIQKRDKQCSISKNPLYAFYLLL